MPSEGGGLWCGITGFAFQISRVHLSICPCLCRCTWRGGDAADPLEHGFAWCLSAGARQMHLWEEKGKK